MMVQRSPNRPKQRKATRYQPLDTLCIFLLLTAAVVGDLSSPVDSETTSTHNTKESSGCSLVDGNGTCLHDEDAVGTKSSSPNNADKNVEVGEKKTYNNGDGDDEASFDAESYDKYYHHVEWDDSEWDDYDDEEDEVFNEIPDCPHPRGRYDHGKCSDLVERGFCHHARYSRKTHLEDIITDSDRALNVGEEQIELTNAGVPLQCCMEACMQYSDPRRIRDMWDEDELAEIAENIQWFLYKSQPQKVIDNNGKPMRRILKRLEEMDEYIRNEVAVKSEYDEIRSQCYNRHPLCGYWASRGECERSPWAMTICAPACKRCLDLDFKHRCPKDPDAIPAYQPGELHAMFEEIANGAWDEFGPTIVSKPTSSEVDDKPWLVTFDNFLTPEECDELIELGHVSGYKRSLEFGAASFDGTLQGDESTSRTSQNAWCMAGCHNTPLAKSIMKRIEDVTGVPEINAEYLQLLKYEVGQFYSLHNDFIDDDVDNPIGHRMLTFFLYLSDVEEGGGTNFPDLNITVMPKKGKAVVWPSVLNRNTSEKDERTLHQALPVIRGRKYGANAWLHQFDYKTQNSKGCA